MAWTGSPDAPPTVRIAALAPSLQPSERRVADAVAADPARAVDLTAQDLAQSVGVGRASVVRAAQSLGYDGYPQLRVALARERAFDAPAPSTDAGALGVMRGVFERFARSLPHASAALTASAVEEALVLLDEAQRVVICANGLSAPLGYDLALRLATAGRPAEFLPDALAQAIAARQLGERGVLVAISGSGVNRATLDGADAARASGAAVIAVTGFARSALVERASTALIVPPTGSFEDELLLTSRAALALALEGVVEALVARRGPRSRDARAAVLGEVSKRLGE